MRPPPTVCFFQAYNREYLRAEALREGLSAHGVPLRLCQVNRRGPQRYPAALFRFLRALRGCDVVLANFRSFELLPLLRLLTRKPIVYDAHISFWQSACEEREWFAPRSLPGRLLFAGDRVDCRLADHVLIDTETHRDYFVRTFQVPAEKITSVFISCEDTLFQPVPVPLRTHRPAIAFWSGSGIPLQGLDVVYEAFRILAERRVEVALRLAGTSPIIDRLAARARSDGLDNIRFLGRLTRAAVIAEIAAADIGLGGHYSTIPKAAQVIAGKVFELVAMGRPVVVGNSPATREIFVDGENALMVEMGSPVALAEAVAKLAADTLLGTRIASAGRELYVRRLRPAVTVEPLLPVLARLAAAWRSRSSR